MQNFRAKPDTKMRDTPDAELADLAATIAVTRLVLGAEARDPGPAEPRRRRSTSSSSTPGIDDWGGVSPLTPDHVNPERPWPQHRRAGRATAAAGFTLRERLTIYPPYLRGRGSTRLAAGTSPRSPTRATGLGRRVRDAAGQRRALALRLMLI